MTSVRFFLLSCAALALTACGFKPVHAPNAFGGGEAIYGDVLVVSTNTENADFLLKQALRARMGSTKTAGYTLTITPVLSRRTLGIGNDDVGSRYDLAMLTQYTLTKTGESEPVLSGQTRSVSTFAAPRDPYSTVAAQDNATEKLAMDSADRILVRLAQYFSSDAAQ